MQIDGIVYRALWPQVPGFFYTQFLRIIKSAGSMDTKFIIIILSKDEFYRLLSHQKLHSHSHKIGITIWM